MRSEAEALDELGGDSLGIADGFEDREVAGKIGLVHAAEHTKEGTKASVRTLAGVAMNLAHAVAIIISRPFVARVADGEVARPTLVAR